MSEIFRPSPAASAIFNLVAVSGAPSEAEPGARPAHVRNVIGRVMDLAKNLKIDSVSRLQPSTPLKIAPGQTVAEAVEAMRGHSVGCVLVCEGDQVRGIFTERDLLRRVLAVGKPLSSPVSECMTPDPVVVHRKESIASAVRRMVEGGYRHLPVVDEAGRLVGMVSIKRIMHYLVEHFPSTIYNLPPDPGAIPQQREGA
jgi:CBS domain-containing protein